MVTFKTEVEKPKRKQTADKNKLTNFLKIFEKKCNFTSAMLMQAICHQQTIRQWIDRNMARVGEQVGEIAKVMAEIKDIVQVGESAKESLFFYLSTNLPLLDIKFPNLKANIKEIKVSYG